ncbi:MAG: dihydrofolate reductase [Planctomycetota bacterium]|nr:dihydrofolate reductase [Planctomycetota bacterium]
MNIAHIVCVDSEFGIGKEGKLPWQNKEEMRLFRTLTTGHVVVMGRKTWESLREVDAGGGKKAKMLKGRTNVVVSRTLTEGEGVTVCDSLESALNPGTPYPSDQIFIIGGEQLYRTSLSSAAFLYISFLPDAYGCDTYYPAEGLEDFEREATISYETFKLRIYKRRR